MRFILILFLFSLNVFSSENVDIYFNAATEKYLQGDYEKAVESIEKAIEIEPNKPQFKSFLIKIVIEAGTNYNLTREYPKAMKVLEKGKKYAPENEKINELYNVTKEILTKAEQKKPESKKQASEIKEEKQQEEKIQKQVEVVEKKTEKPPEKLLEKKEKPTPKKTETPEVIVKIQEHIPAWVYIIDLVLVVVILFLVFLLFRTRHNLEIEKLKTEKLETEIQNVKKELELEKIKTEKKKEEIVVEQPEKVLIKSSEQRLREFVTHSKVVTPDIYITNPNIEQIKNRIAVSTQELYEQSPEVALRFLEDMTKNPEVSVRENVVRALTTIPCPQTLDMLITLSKDKSDSVKREVIKEMKKLIERIEKKELIIPEEYQKKIQEILEEEKSEGEWIF